MQEGEPRFSLTQDQERQRKTGHPRLVHIAWRRQAPGDQGVITRRERNGGREAKGEQGWRPEMGERRRRKRKQNKTKGPLVLRSFRPLCAVHSAAAHYSSSGGGSSDDTSAARAAAQQREREGEKKAIVAAVFPWLFLLLLLTATAAAWRRRRRAAGAAARDEKKTRH